ncbi:hypothetical protein A0H81_07892 [Grifola frondosa]|uniref:Uncharacterized protein n=1 Tax=Grifola frondosa TaxID=5627 RepID=A0A1C7M6M4_GRIFR|nr:hypothetical protein A0H81_07892 [Grifola frondosa]
MTKLKKLLASPDVLTSPLLKELDTAYNSMIKTLDTKWFEPSSMLSGQIKTYEAKVMVVINKFVKSMGARKEWAENDVIHGMRSWVWFILKQILFRPLITEAVMVDLDKAFRSVLKR